MKDFIVKNKKKILILAVSICVIGLSFLIYPLIFTDKKEEIKGVSVNYQDGDTVLISNISDNYTYEKEITIKNNNKENVTYSLEWLSVTNTFKTQSNLLYEIIPLEGTKASLGTSQVPVSASNVFPSVVIKPDETHKYKIKIWYKGSSSKEKDNEFKGTLKVNTDGVVKDKVQDKEIDLKKEENKLKKEA